MCEWYVIQIQNNSGGYVSIGKQYSTYIEAENSIATLELVAKYRIIQMKCPDVHGRGCRGCGRCGR